MLIKDTPSLMKLLLFITCSSDFSNSSHFELMGFDSRRESDTVVPIFCTAAFVPFGKSSFSGKISIGMHLIQHCLKQDPLTAHLPYSVLQQDTLFTQQH